MRDLLLLGVFLIAILGLSDASAADEIDVGADAWVITEDISPFVFGGTANLSQGFSGMTEYYFGKEPQNLSASASYQDDSRGMMVEVTVTRLQRFEYLDHLIEDEYRSDTSGRMDPAGAMIVTQGNPIFHYCFRPPSCLERSYDWRSGADTAVSISCHASEFETRPDGSRRLQTLPCPEPSQVLLAYLQRFPSALTLTTETDARAQQWRRKQTELELISGEFQLDQVSSLPVDEQTRAIRRAVQRFARFAELREAAYGGPSAQRESSRLRALNALPSDAQLRELTKVRQEYRQWWNPHQNDPVRLPPP